MIPALTISELKSVVKEKHPVQEAIIGIIMGRYNIENIQSAIDESYQYWHLNSGKGFDVYWAGYGEYWGERTSNQIILKFGGNNHGVYFDLDSFVTFKNDFRRTKKITYKDTFQLVLCNVRDGIIKFDENIIIDLEENLNGSTANLREIMENVIYLCKAETDVKIVARKIQAEKFWDKVKGITFSDIAHGATTMIGTAASLSGMM